MLFEKEVPIGRHHVGLDEAAMRRPSANMYERVRAVADSTAGIRDEHTTMLQSLVHALIGVVRLGGAYLCQDDLNLLGSRLSTSADLPCQP